MSIHRYIPTRLTDQQVEKIRARIEAREIEEVLQRVADGEDFDNRRVSVLEFIATGRIVLDAEDQCALLDCVWTDNVRAHDVRTRVEEECRALARDWLDTTRGAVWLEERVGEYLAEELECELERMAEARADQLAMRFEKVG